MTCISNEKKNLLKGKLGSKAGGVYILVEAEVRCESINHGISLSILYRSEQSVQEKCGGT